MNITRRRLMEAGGGVLAAFLIDPAAATTEADVEIVMAGRSDGSHVWFDPVGLRIEPGQRVRWTNRDPGNSHTTTSYHPDLFERPRRVPLDAKPWDSGYLLPEESFAAIFTVPGVYDYYCVPHEHAGMVGRIVVGTPPPAASAESETDTAAPLPEIALAGFPSVEEILAKGVVRHR